MIKNKSIDYIFGMITGASLMLAFFAYTRTPLGESGSTLQELQTMNEQFGIVLLVNITSGVWPHV